VPQSSPVIVVLEDLNSADSLSEGEEFTGDSRMTLRPCGRSGESSTGQAREWVPPLAGFSIDRRFAGFRSARVRFTFPIRSEF
jgi:hypothetical protein